MSNNSQLCIKLKVCNVVHYMIPGISQIQFCLLHLKWFRLFYEKLNSLKRFWYIHVYRNIPNYSHQCFFLAPQYPTSCFISSIFVIQLLNYLNLFPCWKAKLATTYRIWAEWITPVRHTLWPSFDHPNSTPMFSSPRCISYRALNLLKLEMVGVVRMVTRWCMTRCTL